MADVSGGSDLPDLEVVLRDSRRYDAAMSVGSMFGRLAPLLTDIAMLVDVDGKLVEATPSAALVLGWSEPLGSRSDAFEVVHAEDLAALQSVLEAMSPYDSERIDVRLIDAAGEHRWYEAILTDLREVDDVGGIVMSLHDIDARVAAEADLARSEAWLRALVAQATDAILVIDQEATVVYASPAIEGITGLPPSEVAGTNAIDLIVPAERDSVAMAIVDAAGTPASSHFDCYVLHASGSIRHVDVVTTDLLTVPAVGGIVVNVRDLSDRDAAGTAVERSEQRLRKLVHSTSDTVVLMDANGRIGYMAESSTPVLGYPAVYWREADFQDIVNPADLGRAGRYFERILESPGLELVEEFRVLHADGTWQDVEVTARNLLGDPDMEGVVITTRVITARKQFERAMSAAHAQALDALAAQAEFVAKVGHEVRTPVHSIIGLGELLQEADLDDEAARLAEAIVHSGETLNLVVDDLLDFSRMKAGRLEVVERPLRPAELAEDVRAMLAHQAEERGLSLVVDLDEDLPARVLGDELRLRQVVVNLLTNALKFTDHGSAELAVSVVGRERDQWRLLFSVSDTGVGIPSDELESVFEPFVQATTTSGQGGTGTGLGLTICQQLVEVMGGELDVRSEVGVGSTFSFVLPVSEVSALDVEAEWTGRSLSGRRVLVVEDSQVSRMLIDRQLRHLGCTAVVVGRVDEALGVLAGSQIDLVFVDLQLADEEGLDLVRRHRASERGSKRIPIVVTTASATDAVRDEATAAGADGFLPKPVHLGEIEAVLRRWTSSSLLAVEPVTSTRPVDAASLKTLAADVGDPEIAIRVAETYLSELDGRLAALRGGVRAGDLETVRRSAHLLRSTSGVVGAMALSDLCERVEAVIDNPDGRLEGFVDAIEAEAVGVARLLQLDIRDLVA